jgi:hypothetical protein
LAMTNGSALTARRPKRSTPRRSVNAGAKMHRLAGAKIHQ